MPAGCYRPQDKRATQDRLDAALIDAKRVVARVVRRELARQRRQAIKANQ